MRGLRIAAMTVFVAASALAAEARIITNGPAQSGAAQAQVVGIVSIDLKDAVTNRRD